MNKKWHKVALFFGIIIAAAGIFGAGMAFGASGAEPGSQGDPLVTLSYLESRLSALEKGTTASQSADAAENGETGTSTGETAAGFVRVELSKGQRLILSDGSMMIVYSGNGLITGKGGLINLSTGELFPEGTSAVLYSIFLGTDNVSGITASGNMTVYVLGDCIY